MLCLSSVKDHWVAAQAPWICLYKTPCCILSVQLFGLRVVHTHHCPSCKSFSRHVALKVNDVWQEADASKEPTTSCCRLLDASASHLSEDGPRKSKQTPPIKLDRHLGRLVAKCEVIGNWEQHGYDLGVTKWPTTKNFPRCGKFLLQQKEVALAGTSAAWCFLSRLPRVGVNL